jgi:hypothetical protein
MINLKKTRLPWSSHDVIAVDWIADDWLQVV